MSWYQPHYLTTMHLTAIHKAVSISLLCSVSSMILLSQAQAATIGTTVITSAQHQPLSATIAVTDINAATFSASLANPIVYQQMGLTPTASMSVRFVPTSATAGTVVISTTQPVSMPFADVVLAINDQGQRNVIPKTLLMPLGKSAPTKPSSRVLAIAEKPNLPVVSNRAAEPKPLTVNRGAPPPLFNTPAIVQTPNVQAATIQPPISAPVSPVVNSPMPISANPTSSATRTIKVSPRQNAQTIQSQNNITASDQPSTIATPSERSTNVADPTNNTFANTAQNDVSTANPIAPFTATDNITAAIDSTDKQLDILNIQVTRQIQPKGKTEQPSRPLVLANNAPELIARPDAPLQTAIASAQDDISVAATIKPAQGKAVQNQPVQNQAVSTVPDEEASIPISYTVQRNDNLWIIAQQIAQQNDVDVQTVMTQIKEQNPNAFIAQDANRLKAAAELQLPNYDVIPSQKSLQTAITAQRQYYQQANQTPASKATKKSKQSSAAQTVTKSIPTNSASVKQTMNKPKTIIKTLPQGQFSVIAPGRNGSADGTQTKDAATTGSGISTDILATLQDSRKRTAALAERMQKTNSTLGRYQQKIQLQNQKLAELEARLKNLRN